jgi:signal transduction histidine kinase
MDDQMQSEIELSPVFKEHLKQETLDLLVLRAKYLLWVSCVFYLAFWGLDWVTKPEHIIFFLIIRIGVVANYALGLILLYSRYSQGVAGPLTILEAWLSILGVSIMTSYMGGFESFYYVGIIFILFVTGMFFPWTARQTILCGVLSVGSYIAINLIQHGQTTHVFVILQPIFFMIGAVTITAFAKIEEEQTRRKNLLLRIQIEKANEDLKELDNAKMRFFANVSHELRTPLTLILGPLEAILQGKQNQDVRPLLQAMEANARRLLRHVNALLDFAKIDAGKIECNYEYDNLGKILQDLSVAARPHLLNRKIDLVLEGVESLPDMILDVDKVETMAANLLSNAIKFTPDGGRITIRALEKDELVWFEVEDTGIGIPEEKLDAIFERFHQVDDTSNRNREGTGLGLAMVKQLAKIHAGKVSVRSRLGEGTTFCVELPKRPDSKLLERRRIIGRRREDQISYARTVALISAGLEDKSESNKETLLSDVLESRFGNHEEISQRIRSMAPPDAQKVLVVEDNPDLRIFIASNLADSYRVEMAGDGVEGLVIARRWAPDLIVSDIMMPRMDGYEFTRQIRMDPSLSQVPVILATAKSGGEAVAEGLEVGANDYIAKPFELRELKARVSAQLRARRLERNLNERESRLAAIGQMTSAIVHDLKNPLSAIIGFAQIARQDIQSGKGAEMVTQDLEPVISEANRLSRMISEVLDFARGSSMDLNLISTELPVYLEIICQPLKQKLATMGIELILRHDSGVDLRVKVDNDRLMRVFENLIQNAQEAILAGNQAPGGKHIWVTTRGNERSVTVRIADDGPGIASEMITSLFDAFATGKKRSGTGLGLSTVRNLVIAHGGEITVEPRSAEGGAAFLLIFPRITNHEP